MLEREVWVFVSCWLTCRFCIVLFLTSCVWDTTDFLDELPKPLTDTASSSNPKKTTRTALLDCCASFGSSKHDVNISLTATGMLWTVADQDPLPSTVDVSFLLFS